MNHTNQSCCEHEWEEFGCGCSPSCIYYQVCKKCKEPNPEYIEDYKKEHPTTTTNELKGCTCGKPEVKGITHRTDGFCITGFSDSAASSEQQTRSGTKTPTTEDNWEKPIYEKWKREHGDVAWPHDRAPEWWVRNYVETRLLPHITTLINTERIKAYGDGRLSAMRDFGTERNKVLEEAARDVELSFTGNYAGDYDKGIMDAAKTIRSLQQHNK